MPIDKSSERNIIGRTVDRVSGALGVEDPGSLQNILLGVGGLGLLAGGGTRLAQELYRRFTTPPVQPDEGSRAITLDIRDPSRTEEEVEPQAEEEEPIVVGAKQAAEKQALTILPQGGGVTDNPWFVPGFMGAAIAGTMGGYKGVQSIAEYLKKKEMEDDLEAAKSDFEEALDEQFAAGRQKSAAVQLGAAMDSAFDQLEKDGLEKKAWVGPMIGGVGTIAGLIWYLSHRSAAEQMEKADPEALYKKVLQRQRRLRSAYAPPPIEFRVVGAKDKEPPVDISAEEEASQTDVEKDAGFSEGLSEGAATPAVMQGVVQQAKDLSGKPDGLSTVTDAIKNPKVQEGVNQGIKDKAKSIPVIGGLFA